MESKIQNTGKSMLAQMLDPSRIRITFDKITWEQGILQAADIFILMPEHPSGHSAFFAVPAFFLYQL